MVKDKKYYSVVLVFLLLLTFGSCAKDDEGIVSSAQRSPFTGKYQFKFYLQPNNFTNFDIDNTGSFDFTMNMNLTGSTLSYNIKGAVKKNGILDAIVKQDTSAFGTLSGQFYNGEGSGYLTGGAVSLWEANYIY